jgi:hypothetical protein
MGRDGRKVGAETTRSARKSETSGGARNGFFVASSPFPPASYGYLCTALLKSAKYANRQKRRRQNIAASCLIIRQRSFRPGRAELGVRTEMSSPLPTGSPGRKRLIAAPTPGRSWRARSGGHRRSPRYSAQAYKGDNGQSAHAPEHQTGRFGDCRARRNYQTVVVDK